MEESKLIDEAFYVKCQRWGTWDSYTKDKKPLITSLTEEYCVNATRFYLKGLQEGFEESNAYQGNVSGKL